MTITILPGCCLNTLVICELVLQYLNFTPILCISGLIVTCVKIVLTYLLTFLLTYYIVVESAVYKNALATYLLSCFMSSEHSRSLGVGISVLVVSQASAVAHGNVI